MATRRKTPPSNPVPPDSVPNDHTDRFIAYSDRMREVIHHENELVNYRIQWLVILNGLAFTATGMLWGKEDVFPILIALGLSGAYCSFSCYLALQGGRMALEATNKEWEKAKERQKTSSLVAPISARPRPTDPPSILFKKSWIDGAWIDNKLTRKFHPLNSIPLVIILVWTTVVANLWVNERKTRKLSPLPVKVTHRGVDIEINPTEEGDEAASVEAGKVREESAGSTPGNVPASKKPTSPPVVPEAIGEVPK